MSNHFAELAAINCSKYVEKKGELSYLSWAWAVDQLLRKDPAANWHYSDPLKWGETMMVVCTVTAFGIARTMHLPVMDHRNKAIANPDAFQINTAMQRCLVKAIALHGLGLYIYAGEDLPRTEDGDKPMDAAITNHLQELRDASLNGMKALETAWKAKQAAVRDALKDELPALKLAATEAEKQAA
jgi:Protein of unknown function (DUF1071).